ncbi:S41 family peptidase [Maribrevibacterium harenarium]|uniref:S41 family peptidase n=1 Tax=Maribrevibacterium harenarium TaxID=2589817 RepID=A0A501X1I9_9GAMM|nr:S41 family peptidase [Maribrevibacterium harenarium]TPE54347.1 S41 family peptidase [Maribrevibacterium harenarium]
MKQKLLALALGVGVAHGAESSVPPIPLTQIQTFVETFETIREGYVEELSDDAILQKALNGMVRALDPHSEYLSRDQVAEFEELSVGQYAGIGVEVEFKEDKLIVVAPISGSPAAEAGIESGDVIIRIDDQLVSGMNMTDIMGVMRGEPGTQVVLDVERDNNIKQYVLERRFIEDSSLSMRMLSNNIGYIQIHQFQGDTGEEFRNAVLELTDQSDLAGLILDLRDNPGGVLQSAADVLDTFISDGMLVYTDGRHQLSRTEFTASSENTLLPDTPLVVLVNEGSASASEVVAGALQDHQRGLILGAETFGKGSVQTVVPLANGAAIKLTTALYYTPNGRSIQAQGIVPDMLVPDAAVDIKRGRFVIKEAELQGHLANGTGGAERTSSDVVASADELAKDDFQLFQAYVVLNSALKLKLSH